LGGAKRAVTNNIISTTIIGTVAKTFRLVETKSVPLGLSSRIKVSVIDFNSCFLYSITNKAKPIVTEISKDRIRVTELSG
jgi:hypothetical protein